MTTIVTDRAATPAAPTVPGRTMLDPTSEVDASPRSLTPRPTSLDGATVALLDINKARGDVFLDRVEQLLVERGVRVRRFVKPTLAKPAPVDLRQEIATQCHLVIEALAD